MAIEVSVEIDGVEVYRLLPGDQVVMPASARTCELVVAALAEALTSITGIRSDHVDDEAPPMAKKRRDHLKVVKSDV